MTILMTRTRSFSSALHEAPQLLRTTNASSTPTILHVQASISPLVVDVKVICRRLEVVAHHPFEVVETLHRVAHMSLQDQSSEHRQLLVMIRMRL